MMRLCLSLPGKAAFSHKQLQYLALAIGILSLGFGAIFVRWANAPGPVSSFYRMAIALVVLVYPFFRRAIRRGLNWRGVCIAFIGGVFFGLDMSLWSTGVTLSGATIPTLLANTAPAWVGLGALILFHERLKWAFWIGLALALMGAVTVLGIDQLDITKFDLGGLFGAGAGVFYAGYFLITQKGRDLLDALSYLWISVVGSTSVLLLVILVRGQPLVGYSVQSYLSFLAFGLVTQVIGWLAINYAQGHLPATIVSPMLLGQPVMTAILAALLLGETLTLWQFSGGVMVLVGVYLAHRSRNGIQ
ncbi:MAG TPA: DMT family transporter [Anaerolineales bacterium]|nr:DMT family transporter [Anaerolineales bacterium]